MISSVTRAFPLPRIQTGAVLGNGETGLMVWGAEHTLNITLGNAALWDHRGGCEWSRRQEFSLLADALQRKDMESIRAMFLGESRGGIRRATLIPLARVVLTLPAEMILGTVETDFRSGIVKVRGTGGLELSLALAMDRQDFAVSGIPPQAEIELKPAWDLCTGKYSAFHLSQADTLAERGFAPPVRFEKGFIQMFPADPSAAVVTERKKDEFHCAFRRDVACENEANAIAFTSFAEAARQSEAYYAEFMQRIPALSLPDAPLLEEMYCEWVYRYAAATNPKGVSPGLQGAFLEDDRLAPWSGDYHFNINAQMVNAPGLKLNAPANIRKLFDLVLSWKETLHHNADCFVREPEGIMLSHAVDDRGKAMGGFWTGGIDHACSAWVAKMMAEYCDIYGDIEFLENEVYPFMCGVMKVYGKLLSRRDGKLYLPVTVSPEYRGSRIDAWGVNASFQLAALHNLAYHLSRTAELLGKPVEPLWKEIKGMLPACAVWSENGKEEIALWEGLPLRESHRHHSHLSGIFPFMTIDPLAPENRGLIGNTMASWTIQGMGAWTGWCMPWASIIRTRCGQPDMAVALLELWKRFFTNQGGASLHDSPFKGFTEWADFRGELMQLDGGMGAITAISELFLHAFRGELRFFFGIPKSWKHAEFRDMRTPGGFTVSGVYEWGEAVSLKVRASRAGLLRLRLPEASPLFGNSDTWSKNMQKDEEIVIRQDQKKYQGEENESFHQQ